MNYIITWHIFLLTVIWKEKKIIILSVERYCVSLIVLQTTKMGLKIILYVYFWLYCCITNLNLWKKFFWNNYLLLINQNLLNFTICRNTKLEGAISGPDRAPILQAQIWSRSGRAFHYWSGARQITLSGPHFSRSGLDRRLTKISAREKFCEY